MHKFSVHNTAYIHRNIFTVLERGILFKYKMAELKLRILSESLRLKFDVIRRMVSSIYVSLGFENPESIRPTPQELKLTGHIDDSIDLIIEDIEAQTDTFMPELVAIHAAFSAENDTFPIMMNMVESKMSEFMVSNEDESKPIVHSFREVSDMPELI